VFLYEEHNVKTPAEEKFEQTFLPLNVFDVERFFFGGKFYKEVKKWQRLNLKSL
jgi:hypothetical protein